MFNQLKILPERRSKGQKTNARRFRVRAAKRAELLAEFLGFEDARQHAGVVAGVKNVTRRHDADRFLHHTSSPLQKDAVSRAWNRVRQKQEQRDALRDERRAGCPDLDTALERIARAVERAKEADRVPRAPVVAVYTGRNKVSWECNTERGAQARDRKTARANCGRSHEAYALADFNFIVSMEAAKKHRKVLSECFERPTRALPVATDDPSPTALKAAVARRAAFLEKEAARNAPRAVAARQRARNAHILRSLGFNPEKIGSLLFQAAYHASRGCLSCDVARSSLMNVRSLRGYARNVTTART